MLDSSESLAPGTRIPELVKGPMTTQHLVRWAGAIENWHRIHYDRPFATEHDKLPDLLINGSWKQHVLAQMLTDWVGPSGWVAELGFQYRSADLCGDQIVCFGEVTAVESDHEAVTATCTIGIRNSRGEESTAGTAVVVVARPGCPGGAARCSLPVQAFPRAPERPARGQFVTDAMLSRIDAPGREVLAPEPVDASSVRRLTQAIMVDDPVYFSLEAAQAAGYPAVVAPPLFPLHIHRRHACEPDPLALAIDDPDDDGAGDVITKHGLDPLEVPLPSLLNGGVELKVFDLARLGDRLASVSLLSDIREKNGRSGPLVFVRIDTDYRAVNRDALLLRGRQTFVFR